MGRLEPHSNLEANLPTSRGEGKNPRSAVRCVHAAPHETKSFQAVEELAGADCIYGQTAGETALVEARLMIDGRNHRELNGREMEGAGHFIANADADLIEAAREMSGNSVRAQHRGLLGPS